jgi:large subunit ribosomal protein L28
MAQVCEICGKKPSTGKTVSKALNLSKSRFNINLKSVNAVVNGRPRRIRVCTSCLKAGKVMK